MANETFLLADIGGTNTRIALGTYDGLLKTSIKHYANDTYAHFDDALRAFLAENPDQSYRAAALAIAGPIDGQTASLTNRDWSFDQAQLGELLGCNTVHFVNDMGGLAYALPVLDHTQITAIQHANTSAPNGQALVLGLGTGVNVSALISGNALAAEIGHTGVTAKMTEILETAFGVDQSAFETVECILSGRGLERLYFSATGEAQSAAKICKQAALSLDDAPHRICLIYGSLLAELIRELALHYLPRDGIYLSGSVARGILGTPAKQMVVDGLAQDRPMLTTLSGISYSLITDDAAALLGCLEIAKSAS